ncbi:MAG: AhpC/TSA family protein [Prevotella sp.]|nr:AhpC/TSA family protein [Prevotella sp.]
MRIRPTLLILFTALLALSCSQSFDYRITGKVDGLPQVKKIYLISDMEDGVPFDSLLVKDGAFEYAGHADSVTFCFIGNLKDSVALMPLFLEEGDISIVVSGEPMKSKVSGTHLNDELQQLNAAGLKYQEEIQSLVSRIGEDATEEQKAEVERKAMDSMSKLATMFYQTAEKNIDNELGFFLVTNPAMLNEEQVLTLVNKMPRKMRSRPLVVEMEKYIKESRLDAGMGGDEMDNDGPIPNFSALDLNGKEVSAMDVIRQNEMTIIDFWASWCGPCMQEMPHMVQLYQLYHEHGLGILGVSLDTDGEAWKDAVKKTGAVWTHISELDRNSKIARMFGVNAIPFTMIVDREGNVLASGLTGTDLEDFLHQNLGQ